jgi:hypothetical protein
MRYLNMTKEMIFERLMAGEDATVIGNELVAMLNEAVKEKQVADEAKRKEEEAMAWQMKDAEVLADVMNDYFKKYCGATEDIVNAEGLVAAADDLGKMLKVVDKIGNSVNEIKATAPKLTIKEKKQGEPEKVTVKTGKEAENWIEDAFADFFKAFNI